MSRLYRPHIPLDVRCRVAARQLAKPNFPSLSSVELYKCFAEALARTERQADGHLLKCLLISLAAMMDCGIKDLHLDHDPALGARKRKGEGKKTVYDPPANSPDHLIYREKHDHHIKTNVRGEHGQHPDRVLIKRERRRREKATEPEKRPKQPGAKYWAKKREVRSRWPKRKMQSRNDLKTKSKRKSGAGSRKPS